MPYTSIAMAIFVLVCFYKIGDLDEQIGNPLGLVAGALVVAASIFFPGGWLRLGSYAIGGIVFLTIYKAVRDTV